MGDSAATGQSVLSEKQNRELTLCVPCWTVFDGNATCRVMVSMTFDGDFDAVVNDEEQVIR